MKRFILENAFPDLELRGEIWRGWIVPVGGSTPDRLRPAQTGSDRLRPAQTGSDRLKRIVGKTGDFKN